MNSQISVHPTFNPLPLALVIFAAMTSNNAQAVDAIGGSARNSNVAVTSSGAWTVLTSVNFANPTQRFCTATGSADAFRPTTANGLSQYRFTVSDSTNPPIDQGQERTLEFLNQGAVWDNSIKEITTTGGWMSNVNPLANPPGYFTVAANPLLFGSRTLYFLARKVALTAPNLIVADASMTVTCTDSKLAPPFIILDPPILTLP
jgi:hypothetical protein